MGRKELIFFLVLILFLSFVYVQNSTPTKAVKHFYGVEPFELVQIPGHPTYYIAILKPDEDLGIRALLIEKDFIWWRVVVASIPGEFQRRSDGELKSLESTHFSYVTVIGIPPKQEQPDMYVIVGETTANVETAYLNSGNRNMEFEVTPYGYSNYYYFFTSVEDFSPENMRESLSIKLDDGHEIYYPFGAQSQEKDLEAIIISTGEFIKENREMFLNGLSLSRDIPDECISFYVNDVPVSHDEVMMSLGVVLAAGVDTTIEDVKERLTKYAIFYQKAQEYGVYPTEEQVNEYLQRQQSGLEEDDEGKAMIRRSMEEWDLTEDEFWNVYQKYHAYNMLTALNVQKEVIPWYFQDEIYTPENDERARLAMEAWFSEQIDNAVIVNKALYD